MNSFPEKTKFKYEWRRYQKRVLTELESHLDDNHLHVIAPPGSGKTVLGLEVVRRLNKSSLIFAPTVAIRNQWIQRFCELFLQVENEPEWISRNIKNPGFLTVVTYQALHAACTNTEYRDDQDIEEDEENQHPFKKGRSKKFEPDQLISILKDKDIGTIVVDEAHHLKNEWWKSLDALTKGLNPTIVGLTATPPYDVSYAEWQRYSNLNGPIDAEISVPELVVENDLCPHQDYIYLSKLTVEEKEQYRRQKNKIRTVYEDITKDSELLSAFEKHPAFEDPYGQLDWIYSNFESYSSMLIFINNAGIPVSKKHSQVIGDRKFRIPKLNYTWMEIILDFYLFRDLENFEAFEDHKEKLKARLKRNGLLERRSINFTNNQKINKSLSSSLSKLHSIDEIVDIEHNTLGKDLRMVILTDYIRKEFLVNELENELPLTKIGVIPIFEQLRRTNDRGMKVGVLTGSIIILPVEAIETLHIEAAKFDINTISYTTLAYDSQYVLLNLNESIKHNIVNLVTKIFEEGKIEILIGTKSLLGEGWDAPAINSLILASFVGSYVLSNQMRGRAIRSDRNNPDKSSNIWHLVCVDESEFGGGPDIELLKRRFVSFVGISHYEEATIENGAKRLNLPAIFLDSEIQKYNQFSISSSGQRELLKRRWKEALAGGVSLIEEIQVPFPKDEDYKTKKKLYYDKTIANLSATLGFGLLTFAQDALNYIFKALRYAETPEEMLKTIMYVGIAGVVIFGRQLFKVSRLYIKYRDISKDVYKIGEALLDSLTRTGSIQTEISKLQIISSVDELGGIYCRLEGGTTYEKSVFIKALQEIVSSIQNPRYIINRKSLFLNVLAQNDYHSVPEILGRNKKTAEYFYHQWKRYVGSCRLIYTRTIEGRRILIKSRIHSLSGEFEERSTRVNKWR